MERLVLRKKKKPNQTSFKKGNRASVGNKNSSKENRGRKRFMMAALLHAMEKHSGLDSAGRSKAAFKMCMAQIEKAVKKGDFFAFKEIFDRLEGRAVQAIEMTGREGKAVQIISREMSLKEAARVMRDNVNFDLPDADDYD